MIVRQHARSATKPDPATCRRDGRSKSGQLSSLFAALFALALIAAACSNSDNDSSGDETSSADTESFGEAVDSDESFDVAAEEEAMADEEVGADRAQEGAGSGGLSDTAGLPIVNTGRDIIFTASVDVEVVDVVNASQPGGMDVFA